MREAIRVHTAIEVSLQSVESAVDASGVPYERVTILAVELVRVRGAAGLRRGSRCGRDTICCASVDIGIDCRSFVRILLRLSIGEGG